MSRVFCDLRSQKTPRGILPVNSNPIQPAAFSPIIFELTFWHIANILTVAKECGEIP